MQIPSVKSVVFNRYIGFLYKTYKHIRMNTRGLYYYIQIVLYSLFAGVYVKLM